MSRVLVVDDMAVFREPITVALRQHGYETECAANGIEALQSMQDQRPDLILLDVAMPKMDGLAFLLEMRGNARYRNIPVILLTAVNEKDYVVDAARLGVQSYLLKSQFSLAELLRRVKSHLAEQPPAGSESIPVTEVRDDAPSTPLTPAAPPVRPAVDPVKALKELKSVVTRSEINECLEDCGELKGMSPTVAQVLKMTRSASCSIDDVAKVIKQDHAISLKILKLANSAAYTRGEPVDSVSKAVGRIGMKQIQQAVMNIAVIERFNSDGEEELFSTPLFWEHSIATGLIAADLARECQRPEDEVDSAFTIGLLHDVGRAVYCDLLGDRYAEVFETARKMELPVEQVESRLLLINHADAMDRILRSWHFPKELINPIALHHLSVGNIRRMSPRSVPEVVLLALTNRLAHALMLGTSGNSTLYPTEEFVTTLKLNPTALQRIIDDVPDETDDIKYAMLAQSNEQSWPRVRDEISEQLRQPFRPVHVSTDPDIDATRIFCDRLRDTSGGEDEAPNIALIHIKDARECVLVTTRFKKAESEAGVKGLPLLILSPKGNLKLEDRTMADRRSELLAFPVSIDRLIGAYNDLTGKCAREQAA